MRRTLTVGLSVLLAACVQAEPATPAAPSAAGGTAASAVTGRAGQPRVLARYDGYGDLRLGMDEASFDRAWGGPLQGEQDPDSSCFYKAPQGAAKPVLLFMFEGGHFVRYDVHTPRETAPGGGRVGMDQARIRQLYGPRLTVQPHFYVEGAKYLRIAAAEGRGVLLFETDEHGRVTRWRVGLPPQVDYVEGCA